MADPKHLILDVNVIIDLWLEKRSFLETRALFKHCESNGSKLWVTAASLTTLDYVVRRAFKHNGLSPETIAEIIPQLIQELLAKVGILTNYGYEQAKIYAGSSDFEDAQIAASARSLSGQPCCIVTEDKTFDTLDEIQKKSPKEAVEWVLHAENSSSQKANIAFIDLAAQQTRIRPALEQGIEKILRHGRYIMGAEVAELEERLADYVAVQHAIGVSSGTDALLIAMMALGIGRDDEVITTPFSFIATAETIALLGAKPVFVDICPDTYNIDPARIEAAITSQTKAIMPVSLYGQCADFDAINTIAERHRLPVIEDGAQSFGATYKGRQSCGLSTIGCTSFFPSKPLGGYGDGGACFTNDNELAKAMREIRVHGQDRRYHHPLIGINGRLDTLQAAVLLAKLDIFPDEVKARAEIGARYSEKLKDAVGIPFIAPHNTSVYAQYTIQVDAREIVLKQLKEAEIPTAVHYPVPLNRQPALQCDKQFEQSEYAANRVMSLPMHPYFPESDQDRVIEAILSL